MLIPLDDKIWHRLYGPYGVQNVNETIMKLSEYWDAEIARDLFWERLHHQDDIYPVTYAALPWLWKIEVSNRSANLDTQIFFAHIIYCALASRDNQSQPSNSTPKYYGLSVHLEDHAHAWIHDDQRLRTSDISILKSLEIWFERNVSEIAKRCLDVIPDNDNYAAAALASGYLHCAGAQNAANLLSLWADEHDLEFIQEHVSLDDHDVVELEKVVEGVREKNQDLVTFVRVFKGADWPNPNQLTLEL